MVIKSPSDKATYKIITLPNRLKALLISDPEADMAAASINVGVGSCSDPREHQGLAHFLEHMLFQGTEKYPDEFEYSKFMSDNGGWDNAFTGGENTNYYFD